LVLSPTGLIYLGFITEGRLAVVLITPSLVVPNWSIIYIIHTAPSQREAVIASFINLQKLWSLLALSSLCPHHMHLEWLK
jgi:hypothetical protein